MHMADKRERFEHKMDRLIDRYGDDVSYADLELVFQRYAQEMRSLARDEGDLPHVEFDDIEGWSD
jgi:Zn-dependent M32 family carboxypeptidase